MNEMLQVAADRERSLVAAELYDGILRLTLANPPANALSLAAMAALQAELDRARDDEAVRVIVLAAAGKVFSAGHDLKEMQAHRSDADRGRGFFEHTFAMCSQLMQSLVRNPKPVIAQVVGIATAAGCQLVASCDLAIASDRAHFGVNGIDVGLFCSTPAVALSRKVARKHAVEMLMTGEMIDAGTALDYGLVNRVVKPELLDETVGKVAQTIAAKSPLAVRMGKEAFYLQAEKGLGDAYDHASRVMVENMLSGDAQEGIDAFIGKRKAVWKGE